MAAGPQVGAGHLASGGGVALFSCAVDIAVAKGVGACLVLAVVLGGGGGGGCRKRSVCSIASYRRGRLLMACRRQFHVSYCRSSSRVVTVD